MKQKMIHFLIYSLTFTLLNNPAFGGKTRYLPQRSDDYKYYEYTPHVGNIITQTKATSRFQLFGDRKEDKNGDGINDSRYESLLELAFYFSPVLYKNSKWSPEPIKIDVVNKALKVDTWDETQDPPDLIDISLIEFLAYSEKDDILVREWIKKILSKSMNCESSERAIFQCLYFDPAGEGEKNWHKKWDPLFTNEAWIKKNRGIYVHPFIYQVPNKKDHYEFIIQYWFYYPYNDAANNHEGDWEHINISLMLYGWDDSPSDHLPEKFEDRLIKDPQSGDVFFTSKGIRYFIHNLDGGQEYLKELTIKRVDYYFHHSVTFLYYWKNKFYYSHRPYRNGKDYNPIYFEENIKKGLLREFHYNEKYESEVTNLIGTFETWHQIELDKGGVIEEDSRLRNALDQWIKLSNDAKIIIEKKGLQWMIINDKSQQRYRIRKKKGLGAIKKGQLSIYEMRPGIHPKVFVGGENQGFDQMKLPYVGIKDSVSGGNYPFPGLWLEFTGFFSREKIKGDGGKIKYKKDELFILPDWECIPFLENESELTTERCKMIRQKWSWLILPIRWGYPSVPSPLRSVTKGLQIDLGDNGAVGPAYNNNWNRTRDCKSYVEYNPLRQPAGERRRIPPNHYDYNLGFLNLFSSVLRFIPVIDVLADRPIYKGFPPLLWFFGTESPNHVFSDAKDKHKLERYHLLENKDIYSQGMGLGVGRISANRNLGRLILTKENQEKLSEEIDQIISTSSSRGTSFGLQFSYLLEDPTVRIINSFHYQKVRPKLEYISKSDKKERNTPIKIGIYSIDIAAELFLPKKGYFRIFPRLGIGYSLFHIQDYGGIEISVDDLAKRKFPSFTFNGGAGFALHIKSFELQGRYIAYLNFPKLVSTPFQDSLNEKRGCISRQLIELKLAIGW